MELAGIVGSGHQFRNNRIADATRILQFMTSISQIELAGIAFAESKNKAIRTTQQFWDLAIEPRASAETISNQSLISARYVNSGRQFPKI
jgi:hypothetical protein